jgi:hypothetical protein
LLAIAKIRKIIAHINLMKEFITCSMDPQVKEDKPGNVPFVTWT